MGGVRARKSRRNKVVNSTTAAKKRKKKLMKRIPKITNETIKANWDKDKTLKQNLSNLGLAYDANEAIPFRRDKKKKGIANNASNAMETTGSESKIIQEFEKEAAVEVKTERHVSPGEAEFLLSLMNNYGDNYKAMAKDKQNYNQHTPKQLRRKCEAFLRSSTYNKYKEQHMETE